jgi:hypothetical protein
MLKGMIETMTVEDRLAVYRADADTLIDALGADIVYGPAPAATLERVIEALRERIETIRREEPAPASFAIIVNEHGAG